MSGMPLPPKWSQPVAHNADQLPYGVPSVVELRSCRDYLRAEFQALTPGRLSYTVWSNWERVQSQLETAEWILACRSWQWIRIPLVEGEIRYPPREGTDREIRELLHWQFRLLSAALDFSFTQRGVRPPGKALARRPEAAIV